MRARNALRLALGATAITFGFACGSESLTAIPDKKPAAACVEGDPCDDSDPCTSDDQCQGGACAGTPYSCDDDNVCTDDVCNGDGTCSYADVPAPCDDGDACTTLDKCEGGACAGVAVVCDDSDPCTSDSCGSDGTCTFATNGCPTELPPETTVWTGTYNCPLAQGKTKLDLTTTRDPSTNTMTGIFAFGPLPENPGLDSGSWAMAGNYYPADNSMELLPTAWIVHPAGWDMVGMKGQYDGPQQQIHGQIVMADGSPNPFCQNFDLNRVP